MAQGLDALTAMKLAEQGREPEPPAPGPPIPALLAMKLAGGDAKPTSGEIITSSPAPQAAPPPLEIPPPDWSAEARERAELERA
jgi:hypothetical protein